MNKVRKQIQTQIKGNSLKPTNNFFNDGICGYFRVIWVLKVISS